MLVLGVLGIASAWSVVDAKVASASAAREAARTFVESDGGAAAWEDAEARGREAFTSTGRPGHRLRLERSSGFGRCEPVTVVAATAVVLPRIPFLRASARTVQVRAQHTEVVDPYRTGLARGPGACRAA